MSHLHSRLPTLIKSHFSPRILDQHIKCVIGYGSGLFPQLAKPSNNKNTVDLILVVENAKQFHKDLLETQKEDYRGITKYLGKSYLDLVCRFVFPIHFNHVETQGVKLKYSIVELPVILNDLKSWELLTMAGRLHKPVIYNVLKQPIYNPLHNMIQLNHRLALNISLLLLLNKVSPANEISLQTLYSKISQISYVGDIRQTLGVQNKFKVQNIVKHNLEGFNALYFPWIQHLSQNLKGEPLQLKAKSIKIKYTPELIYKLCLPGNLPFKLQQQLEFVYGMNNHGNGVKSLGEKVLMGGVGNLPKDIESWLKKTNQRSSFRMAASNFLTGSLTGNIKYIIAKLHKRNLK